MTQLGVGGKLILAFVTLILGVVLVGTIAANGLLVTDKSSVSNETDITTIDGHLSINTTEIYTISVPGEGQTTWKQADCPITNFYVKNRSGYSFTETTDYVLDDNAATFTLVNNSDTQTLIGDYNTTWIDYSYCGDDYMNLGWGRTLINLVGGFFAIAILLVSVGLFFSVGKDTGII